MQIRPYRPQANRAVQWLTYASNPFNALVPFFSSVGTTPEYLSNTTAQVTTESFYWANRIIAALSDPHFGACAPHIERYQMAVGSKARAIIAATQKELVESEDAMPRLEAANQAIADMLRGETDKLLDHVLFESSMRMRNGFSRSDG